MSPILKYDYTLGEDGFAEEDMALSLGDEGIDLTVSINQNCVDCYFFTIQFVWMMNEQQNSFSL